MDIDFVIFWVDGSDIEWQKKKAYYKGTPFQNSDVRYRDWDILRYWFRAVEEYASWVHKVYFVADNQRPEWLNFDHPKLVYVDHQDFIPKEFLPTFQANTIEDNIHRISGLSEHFVVYNDDTFINAPIPPEYYFREGLPCDATMEHVFSGQGYQRDSEGWGISVMDFCDTQVINAYFNRKEVTKENPKGWYGNYLSLKYRLNAYLIRCFKRDEFQHFYTPHNEKAFLKSVYVELWEKEPKLLADSCSKFREPCSLNNYLFRFWQLASNKFYPTPYCGKEAIPIMEQNMTRIKAALFDDNIKSLCLNDSSYCTEDFYPRAKEQIITWFERKFPHKSAFEK